MLNLQIFRKIKPLGSNDDWASGTGHESSISRSKVLRAQMHSIVSENKEVTAKCLSKATGSSTTTIHAAMKDFIASGVMVANKRSVKGSTRPVLFFSMGS